MSEVNSKESKITALIKGSEVSDQNVTLINSSFIEFLEKADEWEEKASALIVTDVSQIEEMTQAREARLALVKVRTEADKIRKELKKESLAYGKAVQLVYNTIADKIKPIEDHLRKQEKFAEVQEEKRREELRKERSNKINEYADYVPASFDLGCMSEEEFDRLLQGAKLSKEAEEEAAAKAEQERLAKEAEEAARRKAIEEENERLKAEAEERERVHAKAQAKADAERKALEAKAAEEKRLADAAAKEEREAREKAEAELKAKQEEEQRKIEAEERKKQLLLQQSDKEKLIRLSESLSDFEVPVLTSEDGQIIARHIKMMLMKLSQDTLKQAEKF